MRMLYDDVGANGYFATRCMLTIEAGQTLRTICQ
jgi:hypothetical protein